MAIQIVGIFCEDIREEKSGQFTIVGVFPNVANLPAPPADIPATAQAVLPKLGLYLRIHFEIEDKFEPIDIKLIHPSGEETLVATMDKAVFEKSREETIALDLPIAGIVLHSVMQGFRVALGKLQVIAEMNGQRQTCGILNFKIEQSIS